MNESGSRRSRLRLPVIEAELSFTSKSWGTRALSAFMAFLGIIWLFAPWVIVHYRQRSSPKWSGNKIDVFFLVTFWSSLTFISSVLLAMAGWIFLGFFPTRAELQVQSDSVVVRTRRGPWIRRRRLIGINMISIAPPRLVSLGWLKDPLETRQTRLIARLDDRREREIIADRPYSLAKQLAVDLASLITDDSGRTIELSDRVDPKRRQMDRANPPSGFECRIERDEQAVTIIPVDPQSRRRRLLHDPLFRMGLWTAILPFLARVGVMSFMPEFFGALGKAFRALEIGLGGYGAIFIAYSVYLHALRVRYFLNTEHLALVVDGPLRRRQRRWNRRDLAAVRVVHRTERPGDALELLLKNGESNVLSIGDLQWLQYLGTLLRHELDLPSMPKEPPHVTPPFPSSPP